MTTTPETTTETTATPTTTATAELQRQITSVARLKELLTYWNGQGKTCYVRAGERMYNNVDVWKDGFIWFTKTGYCSYAVRFIKADERKALGLEDLSKANADYKHGNTVARESAGPVQAALLTSAPTAQHMKLTALSETQASQLLAKVKSGEAVYSTKKLYSLVKANAKADGTQGYEYVLVRDAMIKFKELTASVGISPILLASGIAA